MTKEEIAQYVIDNRYPKSENENVTCFEMYHSLIEKLDIYAEERCKPLVEALEMCIQRFEGVVGYGEKPDADAINAAKNALIKCDHNYPSESGWNAHQPRHCSNCGENL